MTRRKQLLNDLTQTVAAHDWQSCVQLCFRIIYGLPAPTQIELAVFVLKRYLPIFESHWPNVTWPVQLLNNTEQWFQEFGGEIPQEPAEVSPADAAFLSSMDGLLLACASETKPGRLSSSCAYAVNTGIQARTDNVWAADDPQAVSKWRQLASPGDETDMEQLFGALAERGPTRNVASLAVAEREWQKVVEWLSTKQVWTHPDRVNEEEIEQVLRRWKERELLLMPTE